MKTGQALVLIASVIIAFGKTEIKAQSVKGAPIDTGTLVLSEIINNNPADSSFFGKPIFLFSYSGKRLIKSVQFFSGARTTFKTDMFNYDTRGHLTGTTISYTLNGKPYPVTDDSTRAQAIVLYNGNNI